jgi:ATP-dependent DNA helicase DinG
MAQAVARAIDEGRHLVVQAGTGTGKSLAYLLPAVRSARRVIVATATKALQDQLATNDLPFLAAQLGDKSPVRFAVLKGRSNYLCRQRATEVAGRVRDPGRPGDGQERRLFTMTGDPVPAPDAPDAGTDGSGTSDVDADEASTPETGTGAMADEVRRLIAWAESSPTGERGELDFEPHPRAWSMLSVSARECPGAFRCPSGGSCFAEQARARAAAADVVVVNTHLYATDVASDGAVLPEHDVVVFDEAHEVEDVMTAGLGIEVTPGRFRALAAAARPLVGADDVGLTDGVADVADVLAETLRAGAGRRVLTTGHGDVEVNAPDVGAERRDAELTRVLGLGRGRVDALVGGLRRAEADLGVEHTDTGTRRPRALSAAGHLTDDLHALAAMGDDSVAWVEVSGPGGRTLTLRMAPVDIGPVLAERLWPRVTAVLTSATVPPLLELRLGLPGERTDRLDVGSPFPYETSALLYCAAGLPDRRSPAAEAAIHDELVRLVQAAGGRTLALFTSWRAMQAAVEAVRPRLQFPVLAQGDLPKTRLVEAFAGEDEACLFATMSFWQGIDVPGATLSLVTIDRIPFPRPDDPLLEARRERAGDSAFRVVDLPRAATLLAQGAGRLIRATTDAGVVAVLDRRLATAGYRHNLLAALPPMRLTTDADEVVAFLEHLRARHR